MSSSTLDFYRSNAQELTDRYDSADMSALHHRLLKYLPGKSKVVDIGFGSGRDLAFLDSYGFDVYGLDPIDTFVAQARDRFPKIKAHFQIGSFLSLTPLNNWQNSFDAVISIAVWMHLKAEEHPKAIKTIKSLLRPNGIVVLSFSLRRRDSDDGRHFEPLELDQVVDTFTKEGFSLIASECMQDALGRESVEWATIVLKR